MSRHSGTVEQFTKTVLFKEAFTGLEPLTTPPRIRDSEVLS